MCSIAEKMWTMDLSPVPLLVPGAVAFGGLERDNRAFHEDDASMTADELRQHLHREPFVPFCVRLKDGRTYDIRDPYLHLAGEHVFIIGIPAPDDPGGLFYDRQEWVPVEQIDRVDPLTEVAASTAS